MKAENFVNFNTEGGKSGDMWGCTLHFEDGSTSEVIIKATKEGMVGASVSKNSRLWTEAYFY